MSDGRTRVYARTRRRKTRSRYKWRRRAKREKVGAPLKIPHRGEIIARRHSAIPRHRLRRRLNISSRAGINICKITSADAVVPNFSYTRRRGFRVRHSRLPTRRWEGPPCIFLSVSSKLALLLSIVHKHVQQKLNDRHYLQMEKLVPLIASIFAKRLHSWKKSML